MVTHFRVQYLACILGLFALFSALSCPAQEKLIGPLVGHVDASEARIWARLPGGGEYVLELLKGEKTLQRVQAQSTKENDFCVTWCIEGLDPATRYKYRLLQASQVIAEGKGQYFVTSPQENDPAKVQIGFGSGCLQKAGDLAVWKQVGKTGVDGFVLLGDTPYIDTTDLAKQRKKYREFSAPLGFQKLFRHTPLWGTWDDHDFGANDSDGTIPGKENCRRVFLEYRPNATYGNNAEGIYTRFRYGPIEVFLLDTRWWSWTGPSYADPDKKTLLGKEQWAWLQESLQASDATFKLIACGMIWDAKENKEKDHWGTYMHERKALFDFIGQQKIPGVVLIGGDIHVSRVLKYSTEDSVGYPLYQFITSPIHHKVIPSLNTPHPALIRDAAHPHTFLRVTADTTEKPESLLAEFIDKDGEKLFEDVRILATDLISRDSKRGE